MTIIIRYAHTLASYLTSSSLVILNSVRCGMPRSTISSYHITNAATTIAKPSIIGLMGSHVPRAHDVFVAAGKYQAVSDGLMVSTGSFPVGCAGFDAGAWEDMVRLAHWTSDPE